MTRLALLLVACGLLAAGCVGPTADDDPTPSEPSSEAAVEGRPDVADASAGLARATELARDWDANAALRAVIATEGVHAEPDDPPYLYDTRADPTIGDGLAIAWSYLFTAPPRQTTYVVSLRADGTTLYAHELTQPSFFPSEQPALSAPIFSSERAAALVSANATTARFLAEHPTSFVQLALTATPIGPQWMLNRQTASGFGLYAMVNATSGELEHISEGPHVIVDPPRPCPVDAHDDMCGPYRPEAPPTPPPDEVRKDAKLDAFNREASIDLMPTAWEFAYDVLVTADVPGQTPLDERTLTLYGPDGGILQQATGVGHLEISIVDAQPIPMGPLRATISAKTPPAQEQTVALAMTITYTEFVGYAMRASTSGGGNVGFRQVSDTPFDIPEGTNVTLRVAIAPNGPAGAPSDTEPTTWELLDPTGASVGGGTLPGGELAFPSANGGSYTLRITGGVDVAIGGGTYSFSMAAIGPNMWY